MKAVKKGQKSSSWEDTFILVFYRLLQAVRIHKDNNDLVKGCLVQFKQTLAQLDLEDDLTIVVSEERFFIQGERLQIRKDQVRLFKALLDFFLIRALHGLRFLPAFEDAALGQILIFARLLIHSANQKDPPRWLQQKLIENDIGWVNPVREEQLKQGSTDPNLREKARNTYFNAVASVKQVAQKISGQGSAGVRRAKRMVQSMVDVAVEDEAILIGLGTIKDYDDYTYTHSVNVAVLALCLGNRIGLSRASLERIGICGFFHDLGKVEVPREIVNKPGSLSKTEWKEMQKHPLSSVRQILKLQASHDLKSKILLAPFEHHIRYDLTGYPKIHFIKQISLFGRILHITDVYDAITTPRVYRPLALSPDQALSLMLEGSGTDFDPILLKVFAKMMGTYPVGTLLQFDTGEMGLVADYPVESEGGLPRIVLLEKDEKKGVRCGKKVSLSKRDKDTGAYHRNVIRSLNAASYGIQPADFIQ
jgi:HD-GYP domain-containing protein (c-di-GMP phosphodiesterase class II)